MIGFDRPLKPRWIYETLQLWRPNTPLREFYVDFNQIINELSGREGKRKVRTVLFRYFFDFTGHGPNQVTTNESLLASISRKSSLEELKPVYITILISRSKTLQKILKNLFRLFPIGKPIITEQLIDKTVRVHGERDVVKRSTRSFLTTLTHFGILEKREKNYDWVDKLTCSCQGMAFALVLFCLDKDRIEIDLRELRLDMSFRLLDLQCLGDCVKRYNGILWSYIRRPSTAKVSLYQNLTKKITSI